MIGEASLWRRALRSAWLVPAPVLLLYGLWIFAFYGPGHDPRDAILIGRHYVEQSSVSQVIKLDPTYAYPAGDTGYDGEFSYFIALDPLNARYYVDVSTYRYTRILYPLTARLLALGQPVLIPYTLLLINWLSIAAGTLLVALWLRRKGVWPWFALAYGLYPGLFISLTRDTAEAMAYTLVALGVYLFDFGGKRRIMWAAIVFSLAALTRETTVVFPLLYGIWFLLTGPASGWRERIQAGWKPAYLMLGIAIVPLLVYKAFLVAWLGKDHDAGLLEVVPFMGLIKTQQSPGWVESVSTVVMPGLICAGAALMVLRRRVTTLSAWVLLANIFLFVVLLHRSSYVEIWGSARVTSGVVLAALFCLPAFSQVVGRTWFWVSGALWLSLVPVWLLLPELRYLIELTRPLRHRI